MNIIKVFTFRTINTANETPMVSGATMATVATAMPVSGHQWFSLFTLCGATLQSARPAGFLVCVDVMAALF